MKWTRIAFLGVSLAAVGCSTMVVDSKSGQGADLTRYKTFTIDQIEAPEDTIAADLFETEVGNALQARGLSRVPKGGDLLVSARFTIENPPPDPTGSYGPPRLEPPKAVVVVNLVDSKANTNVWTGTAREEIAKDATRGERQQKAEGLSRKVFERFPSPGKR